MTHKTRKILSAEQAIGLAGSFTCFDLGLTAQERKALEKLKISETAAYDNFGRVDLLEGEVARFIAGLDNPKTADGIAGTVGKVARQVMAAFRAEAAWITLRASTPTDAFDLPRWHMDGAFYASDQVQRKAALILKGAGTLFHDLPDNLRSTFNEMTCGMEQTVESRRVLAAFIEETGIPVTAAEAGQGAVFVVGPKASATVHSEPPIHHERLFMSIVPGTKEQIDDLRRRWKRKETTYSP